MLGAIEEAGLADNTVVMFVGDHGFHVREGFKKSREFSLTQRGVKEGIFFMIFISQ